MTNDKIKQAAEHGFIKRATAYGYTEMQARQVMNKHAESVLDKLKGFINGDGKNMERLTGSTADFLKGQGYQVNPPVDPSQYEGISDQMAGHELMGGRIGATMGGLGAGAGGLLGAGAGALGGHLMGGNDEEKSKHRWQGAAIGGGLGALGGAALGGGAAGFGGTALGFGLSADHPEYSQFINQTK